MLTARGVALSVLAVAAWALGRFLGVDELYVVSGAILAMLGLATASTRVSSARIAVRRHRTARHVHLGEVMPIELALRNDGRLPAALLLVEDRRPSGIGAARDGDDGARFVVRGLRPRQVVDLRWRAIGRRRGRYTIGPLRIRLRDPFGFAERSRRYRGTDEVVVFPAIEDLRGSGTRGVRHGVDTSATNRALQRGDEFHTMRAYVIGDDLRYIHWPSTAHRGELMVRQHELPWQARAVVYIDSRMHVHRGVADRSTFERSVSAAASVLVHLQAHQYETQLLTHDARPTTASRRADEALVRLAELSPATEDSTVATLREVQRAGDGLLVALLRPPTGTQSRGGDQDAHGDLTADPQVRALQQACRGYRTKVALIIAHDDGPRCETMARVLRLAGWQCAVAPPGEALTDVWQRAMVNVDVGRLMGARK